MCDDFLDRDRHLETADSAAFLAACLDHLTRVAHSYVTPSLLAAAELDGSTFRTQLNQALTTHLGSVVAAVRQIHPALSDSVAGALTRALRRQCATTLIDPQLSPAELRVQLQSR